MKWMVWHVALVETRPVEIPTNALCCLARKKPVSREGGAVGACYSLSNRAVEKL